MESTPQSRTLLAFDFDHTIVDENTDTWIHRLASTTDGRLPPDRLDLQYRPEQCWTDYMQSIFVYLHGECGVVRPEQYAECLRTIPLVAGMDRLLKDCHDRSISSSAADQYESIIISDSNSIFIPMILEHRGLTPYVRRVFTNPARFDSSTDGGCLRIEYYHRQTDCALSALNMCKGRILREYLQERESEGVRFDRIVFVGDGTNDYCPVVQVLEPRANGKDAIAVRKGFRLEKILREKGVKCKMCLWENGDEIRKFLGFC